MLRKLLESRPPSGYRAGVTLEHVRRNLGGLAFSALAADAGRFELADGICVEAHEQVQAQWLMHIVTTRFEVRVPAAEAGALRLEARHHGWVRRAGLRWRCRQGEADAWLARLGEDAALNAALMPLDFSRLSVTREGAHWCVRLEHMGASEVVNRLPSFRRYIRLSDEQRHHLLAALSRFAELLRGERPVA